MVNCRICANHINAFMSFGDMPIANGFLEQKDFKDEFFFELAPAFCETCNMFQLITQPDPKNMFHENYAFFSQTSKSMIRHFKDFYHSIINNYAKKITKKDMFVVEIGSNDGILLQHFAKNKIKHLGVEPSANVADLAKKNNINTICDFFSKEVAEKIKSEYGPADFILSANVMCHIPNLLDLAEGVKTLLKPTGLLIFEDPYLGDVIAKTSYDQIYDEHVFLFSVNSVNNAFAHAGLEVIDAIHQLTHGGSMRYVLGFKGKHKKSHNVERQIAIEKNLKLDDPATYINFKKNCEQSKKSLTDLLNKFADENKQVVGYAATSKSTTVLNYCNLNESHISYISDTTPIKQGKYTPGTHIPVLSYDKFKSHYPDYTVLFAWNHSDEIFNKEQEYMKHGGKWVMFVPEVKCLGEEV